jgi:hypothetical protein
MVTNDLAAQKPVEEQSHVFVVKFWKETDLFRTAFWRGHVTHIPSNHRIYVQSIAEVGAFIERYIRMPEAEE